MGKVHDGIDDRLAEFLNRQHVFFVGTAPTDPEGHLNLSPANVSGVVTNFQQADSNNDGTVSRAEFVQACKLGLVTGGEANRNIASGVSF